jgi:hypothetical protein
LRVKTQLFDNNCIKFTAIIANTALDAFFLVKLMRHFLFTADSVLGTFSETDLTSCAEFRVYLIMEERFADPGRTFFIADMGFIFIPEKENIG